jgi:drug/metabolite transporter (DMT)-like permease
VLGAGLALGSSVTGGASDFLGGTTSRQIGTIRFMFATQLLGLGLTVVWVSVAGVAPPGVGTLLAAAAAGVALTVGLGVFLEAMVVGTMSIVAPVSATGVVVPIAAGIAQGDQPSAAQAIGIVVAIAGIVVVSRAPRERPEVPRETGVRLALISAVGVGLFFWLMAPASSHGMPWGLLVARAVPTVAFAIALPLRGTSLLPVVARQHWLPTVTAAVLGFISMTMYAFATQHGQLAIISVLASLFPAVTVLLAYFVLGERLHRIQQIAVVAVLVSVVLMAAG